MSSFQDGQRVCCQVIDKDTGRFGAVDRFDRGTIQRSPCRIWGTHVLNWCYVVVWDSGEVDDLTDSGLACNWPYQVLSCPVADLAPSAPSLPLTDLAKIREDHPTGDPS